MRCGIEFEYLIVDLAKPWPGRIRDFSNMDFAYIRRLIDNKPGRSDPGLATGDLGIKSGYWYLEGDERFHPDGRFRTLVVKGIEIRTPPAQSVREAVEKLLHIEKQLSANLAAHALGLGIAGFNPTHISYDFDPPLNAWEQGLRNTHHSYDGSHISTLSYGPDINISMPGWDAERSLDAAKKLNWYSPFIVPFSFSSPFTANDVWGGWSKRTYERCSLRPAVKLYLPPEDLVIIGPQSQLVHPIRIPSEAGRIEYKAFDAHVSRQNLTACCHLLEGICLSTALAGRSEHADIDLYRRAARNGFADKDIYAGSAELLAKAQEALRQAGNAEGASALAQLTKALENKRTPAHSMLERYQSSGLMYKPGGFLEPENSCMCVL